MVLRRILIRPGYPFARLAFLALFVSLQALAAPIELDSDSDGLIDIDEQAARIEVSAGPSNLSIFTNSSGYEILAGTELLIRASGIVSGDVNRGITSGPGGRGETPDLPLVLSTAPHLSLLARVGAGPWLLVGEERLLSPTTTGSLTFAVNDIVGEFSNNSGKFFVVLGKDYGSDPADPDSDGDGVLDGTDGAPTDPTETIDTDGDRIGDNVDPDDDGDGLFDSEELGAQVEISTIGNNSPVPGFPAGLALVAGEFPIISATGTITDGANLESASPDGRADLNADGAALVLSGVSIYRLLGRIGISEWFQVGLSRRVGFPQLVTLLDDVLHLGDNVVNTWEEPVPAGSQFTFDFDLDNTPVIDAILRVEVWSTRENNLIRLNNLFFGRLCANRTDTFAECEIPIPVSVLRQGANQLLISAGLDDDLQDTTSLVDDFQIRNMRIVFDPSPHRILRSSPTHIGDEFISTFEVQSPDAETLELDFTLTHLPEVGDATLSLDAFNVTTSRPLIPVLVNGSEIGTLCQRDASLSDYWEHCEFSLDVNLLQVGVNRISIPSQPGGEFNDLDDFMVRFVHLQLPFVPAGQELQFSYNERLGEFADNTGTYTVTIGSGTATDPLNPDTDGDGFEDGTETAGGSNPTDPGSPGPFDFQPDGSIDHLDLFEFMLRWQDEPDAEGFDRLADPDGSGKTDASDLEWMLRSWLGGDE